jgi:integrase
MVGRGGYGQIPSWILDRSRGFPGGNPSCVPTRSAPNSCERVTLRMGNRIRTHGPGCFRRTARTLNPRSLVRVNGISRRQAEPRILAANEIQALIAALPMDPYRAMVVMALSTGLRCSELFALKWLDVDWEKLTLLVRRAIVDGVVGDVKTKYSQSGLPLDPVLAEILFTWKRSCEFGREADWVFASAQKAGELPLRSTAVLENHLKPGARTAGLATV